MSRRSFSVLGDAALRVLIVYISITTLSAAADPSDDIIDTLVGPSGKKLLDSIGTLSSAYSGIKSASDVLQKLGVIPFDQKTQEQLLHDLEVEIDSRITAADWRVNQIDRQHRLSSAIEQTVHAIDNALAGRSVDDSAVATVGSFVGNANDSIEFLRCFQDPSPFPLLISLLQVRGALDILFFAGTRGVPVRLFPDVIRDSQDGVEIKNVNDWRLGLEPLMQIMSLYIQVVAAADPHIRETRSRYAPNFVRYKLMLEERMKMMGEDIQCAYGLQFVPDDGRTLSCDDYGLCHGTATYSRVVMACMDVETGASVIGYESDHRGFVQGCTSGYTAGIKDPFKGLAITEDLVDACFNAEHCYTAPLVANCIPDRDMDAAILSLKEQLHARVANAMPFSAVHALIEQMNVLGFNSPAVPDGTLLRERGSQDVYISFGGGRFLVTGRYRIDPNAIQDVDGDTLTQPGKINQLGIIPRDGTLVRELGNDQVTDVFLFRNGKRVRVPSDQEFERAGLNLRYVRSVPNGSTSWMPTEIWSAGMPVSPGDLNADGVINCVDLNVVLSSFGKLEVQPGFDPRADTNADGVVDVRDLAFVTQKLPSGTNCR